MHSATHDRSSTCDNCLRGNSPADLLWRRLIDVVVILMTLKYLHRYEKLTFESVPDKVGALAG